MSYIEVTYPESKDEFFKFLEGQLELYSGGEADMTAALANFSSVLRIAYSEANWAGFYLVNGGELVLGPFQGRPAVTRIGYGNGVCGTAWREGRSIVVEEVSCFVGHIACDCGTHAEIVVPLRGPGGEIWGVLDMDSTVPGYFTEEDRAGLEGCVRTLERFYIGR